MKNQRLRLVMFALIILCYHSASAQAEAENFVEKGNWLIGGSLSLSFIEGKVGSFSISPMGGYFVGNKLVTGLSTNYTYGYKGSIQSFYALPFARYYFSQKRIAPYIEVGYGRAWSHYEYLNNNNENVVINNLSTYYNAGVGINYFLTRNVALEGNLRYSRNNDFDEGSIGFTVGLQFFIR